MNQDHTIHLDLFVFRAIRTIASRKSGLPRVIWPASRKHFVSDDFFLRAFFVSNN